MNTIQPLWDRMPLGETTATKEPAAALRGICSHNG